MLHFICQWVEKEEAKHDNRDEELKMHLIINNKQKKKTIARNLTIIKIYRGCVFIANLELHIKMQQLLKFYRFCKNDRRDKKLFNNKACSMSRRKTQKHIKNWMPCSIKLSFVFRYLFVQFTIHKARSIKIQT